MNDKAKLRLLVKHWIEHNQEHSAEFRQWAAKAKKSEKTGADEDINKAADELDKANGHLQRALDKLGTEKP
ncbi:MAG: hypothetical protein FJZ95_09040 [Chloroflexi bacterium]|nr:hypothetical protein [Chloroflexota bacterium]